MSIRTDLQVAGLKEALREINQIDREARFQITRNFKTITRPVVNEAKNNVPKTPPISGWGRTWRTPGTRFQMLPWDGNSATELIDTKVSGKRPREFAGQIRDLAVLIIRWRGAVNTLFDVAQNSSTPQGANMIAGLNNNVGNASRVMWPAYEKHANEVEDAIRDEVTRVMAMVNRKINRTIL
jgi:hypothetical protein